MANTPEQKEKHRLYCIKWRKKNQEACKRAADAYYNKVKGRNPVKVNHKREEIPIVEVATPAVNKTTEPNADLKFLKDVKGYLKGDSSLPDYHTRCRNLRFPSSTFEG